jgi:hypothetical protein
MANTAAIITSQVRDMSLQYAGATGVVQDKCRNQVNTQPDTNIPPSRAHRKMPSKFLQVVLKLLPEHKPKFKSHLVECLPCASSERCDQLQFKF